MKDIDKKIHQLLGEVKAHRDMRRCPKCNCISVEIFDLRTPEIRATGIFRCLNGACPVDSFDPTLPEVTI
jgi:hypothetical protein